MAKIRHNNFIDTVDDVISNATSAGILHLAAQGSSLNGRKIQFNGQESFHFGTTGYLGLEQDERLKKAAMEAIQKYGTQFPLSKTYISHPLYGELEDKLSKMYSQSIIVTKNSTLGHLAVIPTVVRDEDAVILDHQVHWSVQNASELLKTRGIPVRMIRHNNLEMLEHYIKELSNKSRKIWYMADGVYSMYGDFAPVEELMKLSDKYSQLHLYFDDVHGMSWKGKNGTGYIMEALGDLPDNVLVFGTLSKTFGASGAVMASSDKQLMRKIRNFGGPLTFSAQLEPASIAAASASADIHLSQEIYALQEELRKKISYFNTLLKETRLPLVAQNDSPVFYIGTGMPITGYNFVQRLFDEGFYVNLGLYPAVPVKNTGVRITISRHNHQNDIKALTQAMDFHYFKALEETQSSLKRVHRAFKMDSKGSKENDAFTKEGLILEYHQSIQQIDQEEWDNLMAGKENFDWKGHLFLEKIFSDNSQPENRFSFYYFTIRDHLGKPVLMTFFSFGLWKDDMLAPASISEKVEETRKQNPYYMTSKVLGMGSVFTEGKHLYLDRENSNWRQAVKMLLAKLEDLQREIGSELLVLRDFDQDQELNDLFHNHGFIKTAMPESCILENLPGTEEDWLESLSTRSRRHFRKDVEPFKDYFEVEVVQTPTASEIDYYYQLFRNVKARNFALNTFTYPKSVFQAMAEDENWEFILLTLKPEHHLQGKALPVGVMFCYKNLLQTYIPSLIGMDYTYAHKFGVYRQLLYQVVKRAQQLGFGRINFGMSASFEKKKIGASIERRYAYLQTDDNFALGRVEMMRNEASVK